MDVLLGALFPVVVVFSVEWERCFLGEGKPGVFMCDVHCVHVVLVVPNA